MPPIPGKSIKLYIVAENESIGCLLAEDANDGTERAVYYLSSIMNDVIFILYLHVLQDWLMKWAVKGQTLQDFLAQHHCVEVQDPLVEKNLPIIVKHWVLMINGSRTQKRTGAGVIITNPERRVWKVKGKLNPKFSNNQVEYEAMIMRLKILVDWS
ncbi:hypothetical protein A2U01_0029118 [Trifolium medium]|uniref:RNase H type-1 domain-containing protein n=1 Tax=Trifolium medium TaxID=97028 RepID=A0A392P9W0_9FABA|nr:hypothetical protein [Trifolium medium]